MKLEQIISSLSGSMSINIINTSVVPGGKNNPGSLPMLVPMNHSDPLFEAFKRIYDVINLEQNQDVETRLQVSILRSLYQNKTRYFTCTKKSLIALSSSDDMLKHKVQKIHKDSYSDLGTNFHKIFIYQVRKMSGYIPSVWCLGVESDMASWKSQSNAVLADQLASSLNSNIQNLVITDKLVEQMSVDELFLLNSSLTPSQNTFYILKQIEEDKNI